MTRRFDHGFYAGLVLIVLGALFLAANLVPGLLSSEGTAVAFFAVAGLAFLVLAALPHPRWWPLIPAGVMLSLAATVAMAGDSRAGAVFLGGLGVTFVAVYALPPGSRRRFWALITGAVLLLLALPASGLSGTALGVATALALIACGVVLLVLRPPRAVG